MADPNAVPNQAPVNPFKQNPGAYQGMRNQAQQDAGNAQAQNLDAITRRFAAMGNQNSGANIQAMQNAGRDAAQQSQDQIGKINMQEQNVADQGLMQHNQLQEQNSEFTQGQAQQESQFEKQLPLEARKLDLEASQQGLDSAANAINANMGQWQQKHSGGLLGGGGFMGSGL
jgi:hypothetical protein